MPKHNVMNTCLEITKVIPTKKTENISVGDFILKINDKPAIESYHHRDTVIKSYRYHIVSRQDSQNHVIESNVPIAIDFRPTKEAILFFLRKNIDPEWLLKLWETGDMKAYIKGFRVGKPPLLFFLLVSLIERENVLKNNIFSTLFAGIDDYHRGKVHRASQRLERFVHHVAHRHPSRYMTLGMYYLAMVSTAEETRQHYFEMASNYVNPDSRLAEKIAEHVAIPPKRSVVGKPFPIELHFSSLTDSKLVDVDVLLRHADQPFTPVCVMPGDRANGPYSDIMQNHAHMFFEFQNLLNPMLILVGQETVPKRGDWWLDGEKLCQKEGAELVLLKDFEGYTATQLGISGSPTFFIVDKKGVIVQEGLSDPIDYWQLFDLYTHRVKN